MDFAKNAWLMLFAYHDNLCPCLVSYPDPPMYPHDKLAAAATKNKTGTTTRVLIVHRQIQPNNHNTLLALAGSLKRWFRTIKIMAVTFICSLATI